MERKANFIVVGVFTFIGIISLSYFAYWLGKYGLQNRSYEYYETYLAESVVGLKSSSPVKFKGIDVGMVETVDLDPTNPEQIHIAFKIFQGTPVKTDSIVRLNAQGIAGTTYLELTGGTQDANLLKGTPNRRGFIPSQLSTLSQLMDKAGNVMNSLDDVLDRVQKTASEQNIQNLSKILENGAVFSSKLNDHNENFTQLIDKAKTFEDNATNTLVSIDETNAKAQKLIQSMHEVTQNTNTLLNDINNTDLVGKMATVLDNTNETINESKLTLQETKSFVQELRENPSNLLFK